MRAAVPARRRGAAAPRAGAPTPPSGKPKGKAAKPRTGADVVLRAVYVLLVDPDRKTRALLAGRLRNEGFDVEECGSAEDATTLLRHRPAPMVVVSEVALPRVDGFGLCEVLRADAKTAQTPLLLTGRPADPATAERARAAGADDYLPRPLYADDLVVRVQLACGRDGAGVYGAATTALPLPVVVRALLAGTSAGRIEFEGGRGLLTFRHGKVIGCDFEGTHGLDGVDRCLALARGHYLVRFGAVLVRSEVALSLEELCVSTLPRLRRFERLAGCGVPLEATVVVDFTALPGWMDRLPAGVEGVLRLLDGHRTVRQVILDAPFSEAVTLETLSRLYALGVLEPARMPAGLNALRKAPRLFEPAATAADRRLAQLWEGMTPRRGPGA